MTALTPTGIRDLFYNRAGGLSHADVRNLVDSMANTLDVASTESGKGASLVGVEDSGALYTAATVESVLAELGAVRTYKAQVTIATASVLLLNTTPVTLVAAPGAGKFLELVSAHFWLDYNTVAYNGIAADEDLEIRYTNGSGQEVASVEATGFLDATADAHALAKPASAAVGTAELIQPVANAALVLFMSTGNIATGNSPLKVEVFYRIRDLTW